jgi:hypothetical protein
MWVGFFSSEFCFSGGHLLGVYDFKVLLYQTVGYVVYLSFKMQTALSQPLQASHCWRLNMQ